MDCVNLQVKLSWCTLMTFVWILMFNCGGLSMVCPEGQSFASNTGSCLPCPENTFSESGQCYPCRTCDHEVVEKCTPTSNAKCSCRPGFGCTKETCENCTPLPLCKKGTELKKIGYYMFSYECHPCTNATYSDTVNGTCKPIIKCHILGLDEIFPGNRTHNAKCGIIEPEIQIVYIYGSVFFGLACLSMLLAIYALRSISRRSLSTKCTSKYRPNLTLEEHRLPMSIEEKGTIVSQKEDNHIMSEVLQMDLSV